MTLVIIIAAMLSIYARQMWLNKSKPITAGHFYTQLIGSIALVSLIWFLKPEGNNEFKILLTVFVAITIIQRFLSYNKGRSTGVR